MCFKKKSELTHKWVSNENFNEWFVVFLSIPKLHYRLVFIYALQDNLLKFISIS